MPAPWLKHVLRCSTLGRGRSALSNIGFWRLAQEEPARIAVIDAEGRPTTRGELLAAANRVVHGLRARGVRRGDTVAAVLGNEVAMLELFMAAWQAGFYLTP